MITYIQKDNRGVSSAFHLVALSTDAKPGKDIPNGSTLFEMDTCKTWMFDETGYQWYDISTPGTAGVTAEAVDLDPSSSVVGEGPLAVWSLVKKPSRQPMTLPLE